MKKRLKEYNILDLVPQEYKPRIRSLNFFTYLYRRERSLDSLNDLPIVEPIDGRYYMGEGNNRAMFYLLNGIYTIRAEKRIINPKKNPIRIVVAKNISRELEMMGIRSFQDLISRIKDPEKFMVV